MTPRHSPRRLTAALVALTALAGIGAQAIEATQWTPQTEAPAASHVNTDSTREPAAWVVGRGDATEFRDAVSRDTMATRSAVRAELAAARAQGLLTDAGDAGASERVWQRRDLFAAAQRALAQASASDEAGRDPIGEIAAVVTPGPDERDPIGAIAAVVTPGPDPRDAIDRIAALQTR